MSQREAQLESGRQADAADVKLNDHARVEIPLVDWVVVFFYRVAESMPSSLTYLRGLPYPRLF